MEKRLTERDYKALLDAAQWVPSPQGGKIKDPFEADRILGKALDAAKRDAGIVAPARGGIFAGLVAGPAVPSQPAAPSPPAVKPEEKPTAYRMYGDDEKEEKPTNYQMYGEREEGKDAGEEAESHYVTADKEEDEGPEERKDVKESALNYQTFKEDEGPEERKDVKESAANYQAFKEDEGPEEDKDIGQQAVSMVDATKDGAAYVTYTD